MKRRNIILLLVPLLLVALLALAAGGALLGWQMLRDDLTEQYADCIGFAPDKVEEMTFLSREEVLAYQSQHGEFYTDIYRSRLTDTERVVYQAYLYAFENSMKLIFLPESITTHKDFEPLNILQMLSLDTPLMDQNLMQYASEFEGERNYTVGPIELMAIPVKGSLLEIDAFTKERLAQKLETVEQGKKILRELPAGQTDEQKARWIFDYVTEQVEYITYAEDASPDYLRDAIFAGKSNCDGYAGAVSLLCTLAELECYELVYLGTEGQPGHTWNALVLAGEHYMLDATLGAGAFPEGYGFGLTEELIDDEIFLKDRLPSYTDRGMAGYNVELNAPMGERETVDALVKAWRADGEVRAYIAVDTPPDLDKLTERFVNTVQTSIRYCSIEAKRGYALYIEKQ